MSTRIVEVTAIPLARNLAKTFTGGTYSITSRYTLVTQVRLETDLRRNIGGDKSAIRKRSLRLSMVPTKIC